MNKPARRILLFVLLFGSALLLLCHGVSAQDAAPAPTAPKTKNVLETILGSGPLGITIWIGILSASITMVTFVIQNILTLRNDRLAPPPLL